MTDRPQPPLLAYARPGGVRPMSLGELRAWRVTRRLVLLAAFFGAGVGLAANDYAGRPRQLALGVGLGLLALLMPLKRLTPTTARSQIRREIRAVVWLVGFVAGVAVLVGAGFILVALFGGHGVQR